MSQPKKYDPDNRPLKLVTAFNKENVGDQYGYQFMDDLTVLERKKIPILYYTNDDNQRWGVLITVYDFNSYQAITYVQHAYDSNARTPQVFHNHFSQIEGKQAIADAHRALTELGGNPPPLEEVMGSLDIGKAKIQRRAPLGGGPG